VVEKKTRRCVLDIKSSLSYPSSALSNFAPHSFVFDNVECASMEGLLQAFKFEDPCIQLEICKLVGIAAKSQGRKRDRAWKRVQRLWWNGVAYDRNGREYQRLLDRAFNALAQNTRFQRALLVTMDDSLTHSIGSSDKSQSCLTEREFCSRLKRLRIRLRICTNGGLNERKSVCSWC